MTGFSRFFQKKTTTNTIAINPMTGERCYAPHCDSSILHAPGVCVYCDEYPDWQEYRQVTRTNFTGENDPHKAPCPSEHFRPPALRDQWGGNVPNGSWLPSLADTPDEIP
jgi:hypothetical protein